jgi:hypothetical protein
MAIKISGTTVIDDSRNINVGIATVGSGNSAITLSENNFSGIGITFNLPTGNCNCIGIVTSGGLSIRLGLG